MKIIFAALLALSLAMLAGYLFLLVQENRETRKRAESISDITAAAASPRPGRIKAAQVVRRRKLSGMQAEKQVETAPQKEQEKE